MPRKKKLYAGESEEHRHFFQPVEGKNEQRCISLVLRDGDDVECGVVALTPPEYYKRATAWEEYYKAVTHTEAFSLYEVMRGAFHENNKVLIKETLFRLREMAVEGRNELPKPPFKDPVMESHHGRCIVLRVENRS